MSHLRRHLARRDKWHRRFALARYVKDYLTSHLSGTGYVWRPAIPALGETAGTLVEVDSAADGTWNANPDLTRSIIDDDGRTAKTDGSTQYATVPDDALFDPSSIGLSAIAYVRVDSLDSNQEIISHFDTSGADPLGWRVTFIQSSNKIFVQSQDGAGTAIGSLSNTVLSTGDEALVGYVFDVGDEEQRVIVNDDTEDGDSTSTLGSIDAAVPLGVAARQGGAIPLDGALHLAAVVDYVLDESHTGHIYDIAQDRHDRGRLKTSLPPWLSGWSGDVTLFCDPRRFLRFDAGDSIAQLSSFVEGQAATQWTASAQATYTTDADGYTIVDFGGDDRYDVQGFSADPGGCTIAGVVQGGVNGGRVFAHYDGGTAAVQMYISGSGQLVWQAKDSDANPANAVVGSSDFTKGEPCAFVAKFDASAGTSRLIINQGAGQVTATGSQTFTGNFSSTVTQIGALNGTDHWQGPMRCPPIIRPTAISDADADQLLADLASEFGIT